jgi:ketosteroid isomerase-like protein
MHEEIEWIEPDGAPGVGSMGKDPGMYRGRNDVLERIFGRLGEYWQDFSSVPDTYIDGGDYVVVLGHLRRVAPETGQPAEAPSAHVYRFEDGQIVWWRCYEDTALLHRAKGAL